MEVKIGMLAEVTGYIKKGRTYGSEKTTVIRWTLPADKRVKVIVLGKSLRFEGNLRGGHNSDDPFWLQVTNWHKVWMVQPLGPGQRYRKPIAVFEDQIVLE